jgi:hypothetical protein
MAAITARNVDEQDYGLLAEAAAENGRSISEGLRLLIADYVLRRKSRKLVQEMRALRDPVGLTLPEGTTSLDLLREDRDGW